MVNQQLLDYIKQQLQQEKNNEQIKQELLTNGWQCSDIEEAFDMAQASIQSQPIDTKMKDNKKQRKISSILFWVFALAVFSFSVISIFSEVLLSGVPLNSTAPIGFIIAFIIIIPASLIGGLVGSLIGWFIKLLSKFFTRKLIGENKYSAMDKIQKNSFYGVTAIVIIVVFSLSVNSFFDLRASQKTNALGIKIDTGIVKKIDIKNIKTISSGEDKNLPQCSLYLEPYYDEQNRQYAGQEKTFKWAGNNITFSLKGLGYSFYNASTGQTIENPLKHYDAINSISLLPYEKNGKSYLFALANLRATSNRSLLTVYKYPGEVVFEELLERPRGISFLVLRLGRLDSSGKYSDLGFGKVVLGFGELDSGDEIITVANYKGSEPSYRLCDVSNKFDYDSLQVLWYQYGYELNN